MICGKNSYGKSSLIDIIVFNLYNDYAREVSSQIKKGASGIINNNKTEGYSEILIKINTTMYIIRREYKKNKNDVEKTLDYYVEFTNMMGEEIKNMVIHNFIS